MNSKSWNSQNLPCLSAASAATATGLANLWRPYGIRVYVSANFAAPVRLDGLATADPLNPSVADWWKKKVDEIFERMIYALSQWIGEDKLKEDIPIKKNIDINVSSDLKKIAEDILKKNNNKW